MASMTSAAEVNRWVADHVGTAMLDVDPDGRRVVVFADPIIRPRLEWFVDRGIDLEQPDGSLHLDSAGEYEYVLMRRLPDGVHAYARAS